MYVCVYIACVLLPFETRNVLKVARESHKRKNNEQLRKFTKHPNRTHIESL